MPENAYFSGTERRKSWTIYIVNNRLYKMGQDFLDLQ